MGIGSWGHHPHHHHCCGPNSPRSVSQELKFWCKLLSKHKFYRQESSASSRRPCCNPFSASGSQLRQIRCCTTRTSISLIYFAGVTLHQTGHHMLAQGGGSTCPNRCLCYMAALTKLKVETYLVCQLHLPERSMVWNVCMAHWRKTF